MFCKNCGKKLDADAKFCVECGTAVEQQKSLSEKIGKEDTEQAQKQFYTSVHDSSFQAAPTRNKKGEVVKIIGILVLFAILSIIITNLIFSIPSNNSPNNGKDNSIVYVYQAGNNNQYKAIITLIPDSSVKGKYSFTYSGTDIREYSQTITFTGNISSTDSSKNGYTLYLVYLPGAGSLSDYYWGISSDGSELVVPTKYVSYTFKKK